MIRSESDGLDSQRYSGGQIQNLGESLASFPLSVRLVQFVEASHGALYKIKSLLISLGINYGCF